MTFEITINWGIDLKPDLSSLENVMEACSIEAPAQLCLVPDFRECPSQTRFGTLQLRASSIKSGLVRYDCVFELVHLTLFVFYWARGD